ncbi:MAG: O-antigen ligase family protein [candidate division Zixibacteria bacterium]|nr:O-antigen ligase family protein [candidate division Zixibacteria bacterium]
MEPLSLAYSSNIGRNYLVLAILLSLLCVGLAFWSPVLFVLVLGAVFVSLFFSSRTFRWLVFPTVLILNQFILKNSGLPFQLGGLTIQPVDWVAVLLVLSVFLQQGFAGERVWMRTGLDLPIWIFLGATAVSLLDASDLKAGVVNWGHSLLYFLTYYVMVADWKEVPLERIWRVYFLWALAAAASALWQFFASGGERSLGFAHLVLPAVVVPLLCFELTRLSLSEKAGSWFLLAAFVVTAVATQTRGLWIGIGILFIVWLFSAYFLKPLRLVAARRAALKFFKLAILLLLIFLLLTPFLGQTERRAEQLAQKSGSVYLRLFLWGVAWKLFLEHPLTGIGMGQFAGMIGQYPEMKNLAVFEWTRGLSAHNLPFTFLAETGLVGTLAFLLLLVLIIRFAWKGIKGARTLQEVTWGWGFFLIFTVFALSFLFAGVWDYHFTFFLALLTIFVRQLKAPSERPNGH